MRTTARMDLLMRRDGWRRARAGGGPAEIQRDGRRHVGSGYRPTDLAGVERAAEELTSSPP